MYICVICVFFICCFYYYYSHITQSAGWLPPAENWGHNIEFPYGWEKAIDSKNRSYYIK